MKELIEKEIEKLIKELRPEIKKRFIFRFSNDKLKEGKRIVLANTIRGLNPPLITFFTKTISKGMENGIREKLKEIISHEIIHTFTESEKEAYRKQNKMEFFK